MDRTISYKHWYATPDTENKSMDFIPPFPHRYNHPLQFTMNRRRAFTLYQGSSTRGPRAVCGPPGSFVRPGKAISQNIMRYEY